MAVLDAFVRTPQKSFVCQLLATTTSGLEINEILPSYIFGSLMGSGDFVQIYRLAGASLGIVPQQKILCAPE